MQDLVTKLVKKNSSKIVLCVLDGLGGLPVDGKTELEAARTPNLDQISSNASLGLHVPVERGITPGSGAAHLALFGYDPVRNEIGRGVLEALGLGIDLGLSDMAVRGNFATVSYDGDTLVVTDRRAGRIETEENRRIISRISSAVSEICGVKVNFYPGLEHRFVVVLSFLAQLSESDALVCDTDPQAEGKSPVRPSGENKGSQNTAEIAGEQIHKACEVIRDEPAANYMLLRGFSIKPNLPTFDQAYGLRAGCVAAYPMYRGVSNLLGMDVLEVTGDSIGDEIRTLSANFEEYDFFYLHVKKTDSYGEDGDFDAKVGVIEEFDSLLPEITGLGVDVLAVTGDHSTPSVMKSHSWHPVPLMISSEYCRGGGVEGFAESSCLRGDLGIIKATEIMPLLLAHAGRLSKFGA
ncbi:MAG: 2,3-bisphosphoglycerate-independent phosphoglycerate mutase [Candidatus Dadabacteria bacterium]|nr:2,3-bisphosphoglycerate-independent phosphoglycerate mutase [Candidatus Dadabacteria bacterium]